MQAELTRGPFFNCSGVLDLGSSIPMRTFSNSIFRTHKSQEPGLTKKNTIKVTVDVDLQRFLVFSSIVEAATAFFLNPASFVFFAFALFLSSLIQKDWMKLVRADESFRRQRALSFNASVL